MKLFHFMKEGGRVKPGLNISRYESGKWFAISIGIGRRIFALLDWNEWRVWIAADWSLDHLMYRPNDMDEGLICRRCGQYSSGAKNQCKGRYKRWAWMRPARKVRA